MAGSSSPAPIGWLVTVAHLRAGGDGAGPGARALASMADSVAVAADVIPSEGRAIPELAIGPFGAAVLYALPGGRQYRQVGTAWEHRTRDGWVPMDNPLEEANRDAERVRRWFSIADLDFVVRVYAALIVGDGSVQRSPTCAVVTPDQLPAWIAALPSQRSLTAGATASPPGPGNVAGDGRHGARRVWLVGEPGLEPGTSGI